MTPEQKEAAMRLGSALAYGEYVRKFNPGHKASVELDDLRTVLDALATARRDALEEAAKWYVREGYLMDEDDIPDALRALAASQPAPAADPTHSTRLADAHARQRGENLDGSPRRETAPAADTGQAVAWRGKDYADGWVLFATAEQAHQYHSETYCYVEPLFLHPAPLDAERVREEASFLLDRLCDFEQSLIADEEPIREFAGHVSPSIARLRAALRQQEGGR